MLRVLLLGRYEVQLDGRQVDLTLRPVQLLLAHLLLNRGKSQRRERLAGLMWPDYTEASARKNLRNTVYRLRKAIGDEYVAADRGTVALNTTAPFWLDVAQLEEAASGVEIEALLRAAGLYVGELLPGFYEDWILWERERLASVFERVMTVLLECLGAAGRWDESLTWAEHWIAQGQTPEPAYRALMQAHAAQGDQAGMAQAYRRLRQSLKEGLDVPPSAESHQLYQALLASAEEAPLVASRSPAEATAGAEPKTHLPVHETSFIGRQREMDELCELLCQQSRGRLVTIIGPGGIGKTRLALETAASAAEQFADGTFFVRLAPVTDTQHIASKISDSIGFRNVGGDPRQALLEYLAKKQLLLVLDNFEHLLAGADVVTDILRRAPQIRILSTSRERLNLSGEAIYTLSGLSYPTDPGLSIDEIAHFDAAQLLLDRARLVRPGLELDEASLAGVSRICSSVQGMPLALVLAAGWLEMLTFEEVADEISASLDILESQARDTPERQRSVRAAFEYSWRRLEVGEQATFSRLAVFRGGFTRRAARQVAGAGLRALRTLVEKSLIVAEGPDRYAIHELLRQLAEDKLVSAGQAGPIRNAHSGYYLDALARREVDLKGRRQLEALEEIATDLDNVRAAWSRAVECQDLGGIDRAMESISLFSYMRSKNQEGWALFTLALDSLEAEWSQTDESRRIRSRLLARSGLLQSQFGKSDPEMEAALGEILGMAPDGSNEAEIAYANLALGHYYSRAMSDVAGALPYFEQSLERYQALGDLYYVAHSLHRVGYCQSFVSGNEQFNYYTRLSLELAREIGDWTDAALAMGNLGSSSFVMGEYGEAERYCQESLAMNRKSGIRQGVAHELVLLAKGHFLAGRLEDARKEAAEGLAIAEEIVFPVSQAFGLAALSLLASLDRDYELGLRLSEKSLAILTNQLGCFLGRWARATACLGLEETDEAWKESQAALEIAYRWRWNGCMTWLLPAVAIVEAWQGKPERAAEILGLYFNHPMRPAGWAEKWPLLTEVQGQLEETLGSEGYQATWKRGRELDLVQTVEALINGQ